MQVMEKMKRTLSPDPAAIEAELGEARADLNAKHLAYGESVKS